MVDSSFLFKFAKDCIMFLTNRALLDFGSLWPIFTVELSCMQFAECLYYDPGPSEKARSWFHSSGPVVAKDNIKSFCLRKFNIFLQVWQPDGQRNVQHQWIRGRMVRQHFHLRWHRLSPCHQVHSISVVNSLEFARFEHNPCHIRGRSPFHCRHHKCYVYPKDGNWHQVSHNSLFSILCNEMLKLEVKVSV